MNREVVVIESGKDRSKYDNGVVTFERLNGQTRIRVMVHQNFANPPALCWMQLNYFPGLRRFLMTRAYRRFFGKTIDNYCSVAEGKYEPIGRPWITDEDASGREDENGEERGK